tara:strand:- start:7844 stop:8182 length:339 start_codon:yes stop_codon:yes gene_type:complete
MNWKKLMKEDMMRMIIMGLITMCIFAYIDSGLFLTLEEDLTYEIKDYPYLDDYSRPVLLGGIASAIAILISKSIKKYIILPNFKIIEHPIIDATGILIGTFLVIISYEMTKE